MWYLNLEVPKWHLKFRSELFQRIDRTEQKLLEYDIKFKEVFSALETTPPKKGIFYDGQVFDAYTFVSDLVRNAEKLIILIDNYIDDTILTLFSKRNKTVTTIFILNKSQNNYN